MIKTFKEIYTSEKITILTNTDKKMIIHSVRNDRVNSGKVID